MWCKHGWLVLALLAMVAVGCGKPDSPPADPPQEPGAQAQAQTPIELEPPAAAVNEFLTAVRDGDDVQVMQMLTATAREKIGQTEELSVAPPKSDTAEFAIGEVQYLNEDGARVSCAWSDLDQNAQRKTQHLLWVLRREAVGWRIAGAAVPVFPGERPVHLNFENPEEMVRKQQWISQEAIRRAQRQNPPAATAENPENPVLR